MRPAWSGARGRTAAPVYVQLLRRVFLRVGLRTGVPRRAALAENRGQSQPFRRSERVDRTIRPQRRRDRGHGHARAGRADRSCAAGRSGADGAALGRETRDIRNRFPARRRRGGDTTRVAVRGRDR